MSIKAGLVGLPNVGKSTLFNALTNAGVPAENYPFCTIDPHNAITHVPDERLQILAHLYHSKKIVPAEVVFADIAGLVPGAAQGEGLGNQFLSHIREVDLIIHVIRCFEDENVISTTGRIDPLADFDLVQQELMLKDLESINKRLEKIEIQRKSVQNKPAERKMLETEEQTLLAIKNAVDQLDADTVKKVVHACPAPLIPLLSSKNFIIIANVSEDELAPELVEQNNHVQALIKQFGVDRVIPLCVKLENELAALPTAEARELMRELGMPESGLNRVIRTTYHELGLITFFTCGPQETHAWPIKRGTTIRAASGEIHSDFEHGFICAEILNYTDLVATGSEVKAKEIGKMRTQGQEYIVVDGDIVLIKFNV